MKEVTLKVVEECAALSHAGKIAFPEVIRRLSQAGVERYHADYTRGETTYYTQDGESHAVPLAHGQGKIGEEFSAQGVAEGVRKSQRGEIVYAQFLELSKAAGCVGYFVQITGQRVIYFGRKGDMHIEWFPGAKR